jgi:hypothetical protein
VCVPDNVFAMKSKRSAGSRSKRIRNYILPSSTPFTARAMTVQNMAVGTALIIKQVDIKDLTPDIDYSAERVITFDRFICKFTAPQNGVVPFDSNLSNVFTAQVFGVSVAGVPVPLSAVAVLGRVNPVTLSFPMPDWLLGPQAVGTSFAIPVIEIHWRSTNTMVTGGPNMGCEIIANGRISNAIMSTF